MIWLEYEDIKDESEWILYISLLMPPTWYPIFILYISPSLVHFCCSDHTATYYPQPLHTSNRDYHYFS